MYLLCAVPQHSSPKHRRVVDLAARCLAYLVSAASFGVLQAIETWGGGDG